MSATSIASTDEHGETRAAFTGRSTSMSKRIGGETEPQSSPLLSSTPTTVSKVLIRAYPYLIIVDKLLSVLTWTNDDAWLSILMLTVYAAIVLYFEAIITYFGHISIVILLVAYSYLTKYVENQINTKQTLDDIVHLLTQLNVKADLLLNPVTSLALTSYDIKRILFTTVFLSPLYVIITYFVFSPRAFLLVLGVFLLSYHSLFSRVARRMLWKFRLVRLLSFYLTGLDFGGININKESGIFAAVKRVNEKVGIQNKDGKAILFTYVLYENQRRWLGIGWTPNLLSYERTAWTDEFMNESSPTDQFRLPETEDGSGLVWRWVDKTWRLDLTNDGAIQLPSSKPKTTANPATDDGFIYYDNTWKRPSTDDSFSKYTRRRRWIRTAELVPLNAPPTTSHSNKLNDSVSVTNEPTPIVEVAKVEASGITHDSDQKKTSPGGAQRKRKSLKFDDKPTILESVKKLEEKTGVSFAESKTVIDQDGTITEKDSLPKGSLDQKKDK